VAVLGSDGVSDVFRHASTLFVADSLRGIVAMASSNGHLDLDDLAVAATPRVGGAHASIAPLVLEQGTASPVNPIASSS